jgi:hypothetical protein
MTRRGSVKRAAQLPSGLRYAKCAVGPARWKKKPDGRHARRAGRQTLGRASHGDTADGENAKRAARYVRYGPKRAEPEAGLRTRIEDGAEDLIVRVGVRLRFFH